MLIGEGYRTFPVVLYTEFINEVFLEIEIFFIIFYDFFFIFLILFWH